MTGRIRPIGRKPKSSIKTTSARNRNARKAAPSKSPRGALRRVLEKRLKAEAKRARDGRLKAPATSRPTAAPRTPAKQAIDIQKIAKAALGALQSDADKKDLGDDELLAAFKELIERLAASYKKAKKDLGAAPKTGLDLRPRDMRTMFVLKHLDALEKSIVGLQEWKRTFRAAAAADDYVIFRDHLRRLGLPDKPKALLEGTIHFVVMWAAFFSTDHTESFADLLRMQTYDPDQATDSVYAFTYDLCGKAYARVLVDKK